MDGGIIYSYRTAQSQLSSIILALSGTQRVWRVVRGSLKREINNPINLLNIQRNVRRGLDMQAIEVVLMIAALAAVLSAIGAWIAAQNAQHWAAKALQSEITAFKSIRPPVSLGPNDLLFITKPKSSKPRARKHAVSRQRA